MNIKFHFYDRNKIFRFQPYPNVFISLWPETDIIARSSILALFISLIEVGRMLQLVYLLSKPKASHILGIISETKLMPTFEFSKYTVVFGLCRLFFFPSLLGRWKKLGLFGSSNPRNRWRNKPGLRPLILSRNGIIPPTSTSSSFWWFFVLSEQTFE